MDDMQIFWRSCNLIWEWEMPNPLHLFEDIAMKHSERNCFILRMGKFGIINDDFGFYNQQYG